MADPVPTTDEDDGLDFPMPEGFEPPKGTKPGQEFEALATLRLEEDGDITLLKIDGTDVKPEDETKEPAEGEPSAIDSMKASLPATGIPAGSVL